MTTAYFISGTVFIIASGAMAFYKWRAGINKKYEEAISDAQAAVDKHDTAAVLDAIRRMRQHR